MVDVDTDRDYWNARYSRGYTSGAGSYGGAMLRKVRWLSELPGIGGITEIGCGDFHFGRHLVDRLPHAYYAGHDISGVIIERNRRLYELGRVKFYEMGEAIVSRDLLLCVDVLFHVVDDEEYIDLLALLGRTWTKYLALSAYEYDGLRQGHIAIRKFNPEFFGTPILREVIEDDGEMRFYIFKR